MAAIDAVKLQCPACRSQKLEIAVTAVGSVNADFTKKGKDAFAVSKMEYSFAPDARVACQACGHSCSAAEATAITPFAMLMDLLTFMRQLPLVDDGLLGARVNLLKKIEGLMRDHADKLREPL
jgi:hypothetical protein